MTSSLASQANALRVVKNASASALRRAGIVTSDAQGELLIGQLIDAARTLDIINNDERVRAYVAKALQASA